MVAIAIASVDADVAEVAIVVGCGEYTAHTAIDGEMFADAVTGTEGEPVEVLAAVHVGVDVVAVETECVVGIADGTEAPWSEGMTGALASALKVLEAESLLRMPYSKGLKADSISRVW